MGLNITMLEYTQACLWPVTKVLENLIHDGVQTGMTLAEKTLPAHV